MNIVILIGRLTRDPEIRELEKTGISMCSFTLAVDKKLKKDKKAAFEAAGKATADFIRVATFGSTANNCYRFLAKGRLTAVKGTINTSTYQDKDGTTRYSTDILAQTVEFIEWPSKQDDQNNKTSYNGDFSDDFLMVDNQEEWPF